MSAIAEPRPRRLTLVDRVSVALPLTSIYVWLCAVYAIEAWKRVTPWLFTDELEFTQIQRSIASTGHPARRGVPHGIESLYNVVFAPIWLIHSVSAAFATLKYADVLVMTSVLFPTYFLARMVVGRTPALFAAAGAAIIPSMAYSSWIVTEVLAYPYAALCMLLIAKALYHRSRWWIVGAVAAAALAPVVRGELVVIPVTFAFALLFLWWTSARMLERERNWSLGDWLGVVTLFFGAVYLISGYVSRHDSQWYSVTTYWKHRIFVFGDWASGAITIGVGVLPVVLGLAALAPIRGEVRDRALRVYRCVGLAGIAAFWMYTAMKGAYLSTVFASRVEERNLIYVSPLLFIGTALVLERRRVNLVALGAAAAYALYVIVGTPFFLSGGYYSDALSLALLGQANRYFLLGSSHAQWILILALVVGLAGTALVLRLRPRRAVIAAAVLGALVLAWTGTGEFAAAVGNVTLSRDIRPTIGEPFTWVDDATHLKPTLYLAQGVADQNPEWLLEFWNRSIQTVSSLDGTIGGPGPAGAPNITPRGQLYWTLSPADPGKIFDYAVADGACINFVGTTVATHPYRGGVWRLVRLTKPNRLAATCQGIYSDGWSGPNDSTYFRYVAHRSGWLRITLDRQGFFGSPVDVQIGNITLQENSPVIGTVTRHVHGFVHSGRPNVIWVRTPAHPFGVHTVIVKKFVPNDINHRGDVRTVGALTSYRWFATKPKG
jgi:hypothetical protein